MSVIVSPMASEAASPMITSITPTMEPGTNEDLGERGGGSSRGSAQELDPTRCHRKPPPLHTGADWKVVLHLPEIETWLRGTADRVRDLTHSVHQDTLNKHVDVHLVQLKDICEDISDHVEQIHALLETEFSLKLLSYSVNIIVDIRTVQLLWHQLRVSVLVLKERLLQGLQDANGNYTRQTDILQAFSQDHDQARLDALTEVDDSGQLTIKCSQDYFSLDCGITAFELSDYSPGEEPEGQFRGLDSQRCFPELEQDFPEFIQNTGLLTVATEDLSSPRSQDFVTENKEDPASRCEQSPVGLETEVVSMSSTMNRGALHSESALSKRPLQDSFNYNEVSPTQPCLPKKAMFPEGLSQDDAESILKRIVQPSLLQFQADLSRSTPSLLDTPDRSKFWLDLTSIYPNTVSQSCESLNAMNGKSWKSSGEAAQQKSQVPGSHSVVQRSSSECGQASDPESPRPKPPENCLAYTRGTTDLALKKYTDLDPCGNKLISPAQLQNQASPGLPEEEAPHSPVVSLKGEPWYGSDEYLALPSQLKKTEKLAIELETLAKALPQRAMEQPTQNVDDWELSEAHSDWEGALPVHGSPRCEKIMPRGRFSPTSSSDIAPSLDDSIESGPLSDLLSEDEAYWHAGESRSAEKSAWLSKSATPDDQEDPHKVLIQRLLQDMERQENDKEAWSKIESFVTKLDEFICWLQEALETTENWLPPKADTDSLRLYLETHLSFKLNVDSHSPLKDGVLDEGRQLLEVIISNKSGLRELLHSIAQQWYELQRQVRRQHSWILRALEGVKARLLASEAWQEVGGAAPSPEGDVLQCHHEAQRAVLDQMSLKLSQQYCTGTKRRKEYAQMSKVNTSKSNSLSDFESEYQEVLDWLIDTESMLTDSHELMMSHEQREHLYKGKRVEIHVWLSRKNELLKRARLLHHSGVELPADFEERVSALTHKWDHVQKSLGELAEAAGPVGAGRDPRELLSPESSGMLRQLESSVKELRTWLRDTELLIFSSRAQHDREHQPQAAKQLQYFKSLCVEVRARRRGVASILRLCQRLLEERESEGVDVERQALQLLAVNLERRWEAIVMQALQWQTRLQRTLGTEQVPGNIIEPAFIDLHGPVEDSWEWDDMDITNDLISVNVESHDYEKPVCQTSVLPTCTPRQHLQASELDQSISQDGTLSPVIGPDPSSHSNIYHVYSVHNVELFNRPQYTFQSKSPAKFSNKQTLMKSLSKDSSFSSAESVPDLLGGILCMKQGADSLCGYSTRRSESESGIMSEGDTETTANSEIILLSQVDESQGSPLFMASRRGVLPSGNQICNDDCIDGILESAKNCVLHKNCDAALLDSDHESEGAMTKINGSAQSKRKQSKGSAEILIEELDPQREELDPADFGAVLHDERGIKNGNSRKGLSSMSPVSSLDSLCVDGDLFVSSKDMLHRSTSLESWLAPSKSTEEVGSQHSLRDLGLTSGCTGELSKRTLELLKRLENVQTPLVQRMTRSISDITLQSSSLRMSGPSQLSLGAASTINESSAPSLTELNSTEDSSVASEDIVVQRNCLVDAKSLFRKHCRNQPPVDEADASISMVVNVSCTSACTDDEDDSDLLSSSTLTLTEEELGIKDDEDSSIASDEEYVEGGFVVLECMKNELQNWIKPRSQCKETSELDLGDELQCGTLTQEKVPTSVGANERRFLSRSALKLLEGNTNEKNSSLEKQDIDSQKREITRSFMRQFVDDMENGNIENSQVKKKDEDDELLREEGSLFTKNRESLYEDCYAPNTIISGNTVMGTKSELCDHLSSQGKESALEGQLSGEIPCFSSSRASVHMPSAGGCMGSHQCIPVGMHGNTYKENLCPFSKDSCESHEVAAPESPCCSHSLPPQVEGKTEDVHNFVMEIIDMTSVALKNKETQASREIPSPTPVTHIRDKVLEHSHRSIQLRKGDFYSYLSLSSHDSDCGEVSTCVEDKGSTPPPRTVRHNLEIHDKEPLFEACTEEVYLGPPLCYSMCLNQKPVRKLSSFRDHCSSLNEKDQTTSLACTEYRKAPGISPGSTAGSQPEYHNEAAYLNPLPCETLIDTVECFADTKMLESNISPVMTKIRVSCSSTNPLKEDGSLYINPKINCPQIRKCDRDEKGPASQQMKQKNVRNGCSSLQEAKSAHKQLIKPERSLAGDARGLRGTSPTSSTSLTSASRRATIMPATQENRAAKPMAKRVPGSMLPQH